jgi:hypothetical protein
MSYPTVAKALDRLRPWLTRHSDRRVELSQFPKDEWARLLAVADDVRGTLRFADRSGHPRSVESLQRRLENLRLTNAAIGGAIGAKHYFSDLDLVGVARLDVTVNVKGRQPDLEFVRILDPALERTNDTNEAARLVVHFIRRNEPLFDQGSEGQKWADPVECLLDLHEARLEPQAKAFLTFLRTRRDASSG